MQKVAKKRKFETGLRHATTGKFSLTTLCTFFVLGKDKVATGEGWGPPFISCAEDTVGHKPPLALRLLDYGKPFTLIK